MRNLQTASAGMKRELLLIEEQHKRLEVEVRDAAILLGTGDRASDHAP